MICIVQYFEASKLAILYYYMIFNSQDWLKKLNSYRWSLSPDNSLDGDDC